ncbi:glucan endo-1,3-beta-glucosidase, acidic isoform-like [Lolium rigidum]|uniref:glucan endo-1,3-beta-glucosidase, acidic isoform-like n=1 Tax=Lolium rigidum TaxID=89674 RepID=UPI001F5DF525|nr:glucan endo-1,3-beta-glucosidase, acidic isoform-like [Lolium rigidum]
MAAHRAAAYMVAAAALVLGVLAAIPAAVQSIGVCYGVNGNGLPSASDVVQLYLSNGISGMRIYSPDGANRDTLQALRGSDIDVILDVGNGHLADLAACGANADSWVQANVKPYKDVKIKYIVVGNEVPDLGGSTCDILPAMHNVHDALARAGLGGIKVSTAVNSGVTTGFPPSQGTFSAGHMPPIAQYLASTGAPLLANVYPYFTYTATPGNDLNYALFTSSGTVVQDWNGLGYQNMFDSLVDTFYAALESAGAGSVTIVVSESGWPSAGDTAATPGNAQTYNQNLIKHVGQGTPKRPGAIETYVCAMFNEDKNTGAEIEKHFGLFYPDQSPVYSISF